MGVVNIPITGALAGPAGGGAAPTLILDDVTPAFEGFGYQTTGGQGGDLVVVSNLNATGAGSLKAALEATGPRLVVFAVGGVIDLAGEDIYITSDVSVFGQTAVTEPITITNGGVFIVGESNVLLQHIRLSRGTGGPGADSLSIQNSSKIVVDHCCLLESLDELVGVVSASHDITFTRCLMYDALGYGLGPQISNGSYNVTMMQCLLANNIARNPKLKGEDLAAGIVPTFDFVNNVIFNWYEYACSPAGSARANVVKNYFKPGLDWGKAYRGPIMIQQLDEGRSIWAEGNYFTEQPNDYGGDDYATIATDINGNQAIEASRAGTRHAAPALTELSALDAYTSVLGDVGCTLPAQHADDAACIAGVADGTGRIKADIIT